MKGFTVFIFLSFAMASHAAYYWTPWLDSDDPSGVGDWEALASFNPKPCNGHPVHIQCRDKSTKRPFWFFGQKFLYPCCADEGLVCRNKDNTGTCRDYEVRFLCSAKCNWESTWYDRDDPSGTGDYEDLISQTNPKPCGGQTPIKIDCKVKNTNIRWYSTGEKFIIPCTPTGGLACRTKDQPKGKYCKDYEVRYCCPVYPVCNWESTWYDRDNPSGYGDFENLIVQTNPKPCGGKTPIKIDCKVKNTNTRWDSTGQKFIVPCTPTGGLACRNKDQPNGKYCKDYEVRYCCPA